ncbi:MAG: caspase family protein [Burkholderiales bacterium]|nr:caspase family protein [Burkholderiales bacterium]
MASSSKALKELLPALNILVFVGALTPALLHAQPASGKRSLSIASRHALIIGVGEYMNSTVPSLKGIQHDMDSATRMAESMSIPKENIRYVRDLDATSTRIEQEINELVKRTQPGDRVFLYYSGHGTRWYDEALKKDGCVEALLPSDSKPLTNQRMAALLKPISDKTDKLFVFYDACHSGGVVDKPLTTRSFTGSAFAKLTPKYSPAGVPSFCATPANLRTRSFTDQASKQGALPQNIVEVSSSRQDEISFDDETGGGLATQAWRDCMLSDAEDIDNSGAISVDEIAACAQGKIDKRFANNAQYAAPHITIGGNRAFIPNLFASNSVAQASTDGQSAAPIVQVSANTQTTASAAPAVKPPASAALDDIYAQRDARRKVSINLRNSALRIGKDNLDFSVTSSHDGYVYLIMLGSDDKSYYLLFPNELDQDNAISAGQTLKLPRKKWQITAQGPAGTDRMLAVVAESPRDLSLLGNAKEGPFITTLTDPKGRANLQWLTGTSVNQGDADCSNGGRQRGLSIATKCSNAFGAAVADIIEK